MNEHLPRKFSIDDEVDLGCVLTSRLQNSMQHNVFIRAKLLEKANEYYDKGKEHESIAHLVEALCIGFRSKFDFSKNHANENVMDTMAKELMDALGKNHESSFQLPAECCPDFSSLDEEIAAMKTHRKPVKSAVELPSISTLDRCSELPSEWTVVQITKQFDPLSSTKSAAEILESNSGIYLTALRYPHMDLHNDKPLTIRLPTKSADLFAKNAKICEMIKAAMKLTDIPLYTKTLAEIDKTIAEVLEQMFLWLGPYIVLFLGAFKDPKARKAEVAILERVKEFFAQEKLSNDTRQLAMTFLICRGIDLLNYEDLESYAINFSANSQLSKRMLDFLCDIKETSRLSYKSPSYPSIIIVDELLDGFYWEMLLPDKEMCRCSALHILLEITKRYRRRIKDGYLRLDIERGTALINLGDDLPLMEKRITSFFDYWKPSWKKFIRVSPTAEEIKTVLKENDVIVYSGHGSGQQFVNPETIQQLDVNSVVFLFGCESVKLVSYGRSSERVGIHLFYHYILCPLIVGAVTIVTDTPTDQICVMTLSTWMRSDKPREKHLQYLDRKKFKEGKLEFSNSRLFKELTEENDPNLLNIFTRVRQIAVLPLWMRGAFVLRGIPVWNTNSGQS